MLASKIASHEESFKSSKKDTNGTEYTFNKTTYGDVPVCELTPSNVSDYYYESSTEKTAIVLHFTAGYLKGDLGALCKNDNHVSVPFVIARDGTIYKLFDPKYWSYHLGKGAKGGNTNCSKKTIAIEISNIGPLTKSGDEIKTVYGDKYCGVDEKQYYQELESEFRGYKYFATFTDPQYDSLQQLISKLCDDFSIPCQLLETSKRYSVFATDDEAKNYKGICSHINYRESGKWDIGEAFEWDRIIDGGNKFLFPVDLGNGNEIADNIDTYYNHTEKDFTGGYFPIGSNTTWHGGLHLLGKEGDAVYAIADGEVVCARMPSVDPQEENLRYGARNLVLIKHTTDEKIWYSLYYHLKSIAMDSEEAKAIAWLKAQSLKFTSGSNMRKVPATEGNDPIHTFKNGDIAEILSKADAPWYEVINPENNQSGFVKFSTSRMEEIETVHGRLSKFFTDGTDTIIQVKRAVKAGDLIGYIGNGITMEDGEIVKKPILHWAVFSKDILGSNWTQIEDADQNYTCNSERIVKLVDKDENHQLTGEEIVEFFADEEKAKAMRKHACKFKTEWSMDWNSFSEKIKQQGITARVSELQLYNFWEDAVKCDDTLPADGHIWHYNPVTFIERQLFCTARATFLADTFEPDRTLPLPFKTGKMLRRIGAYISKNATKNVLIIAHAGVDGDTLDAAELSQMRGNAMKWMLTLDKEAIAGHIKDEKWGDRERKIMLSYFKNGDGEKYFSGEIDETPTEELSKAVEAFQGDNGLSVDGAAGPATFTKMFEVILEQAGISGLSTVEVIAAGDNHPSEAARNPAGEDSAPAETDGSAENPEAETTAQSEGAEQGAGADGDGDTEAPGRLIEVLLWKSKIDPEPATYAEDAPGSYAAWVECIQEEIGPKLHNGEVGIAVVRAEDDAAFEDEKYVVVTGDGETIEFPAQKHIREGDPPVLVMPGLPSEGQITLLRYPGKGIDPYCVFKDVDVTLFLEEDPEIVYNESQEEETADATS